MSVLLAADTFECDPVIKLELPGKSCLRCMAILYDRKVMHRCAHYTCVHHAKEPEPDQTAIALVRLGIVGHRLLAGKKFRSRALHRSAAPLEPEQLLWP